MHSLIHATNNIQIHAATDHLKETLQHLGSRDWTRFQVALAVLESSVATGRPAGKLIQAIEDGGRFFVIDLGPVGGREKFLCCRRGRQVIVAAILSGHQRAGRREIATAEATVKEWRRSERWKGQHRAA